MAYLCIPMLLAALISFFLSAPIDTLAPSYATAAKEEMPVGAAVTAVSALQLKQYGVTNPKDLQALVPGVHLPDYGASLTSSIYVRGFGSRMENPVIGLYVDDFPILDKNSYDLDYLDLASVKFLHGPQGTAYGRNALRHLPERRCYAPGWSTAWPTMCGRRYPGTTGNMPSVWATGIHGAGSRTNSRMPGPIPTTADSSVGGGTAASRTSGR